MDKEEAVLMGIEGVVLAKATYNLFEIYYVISHMMIHTGEKSCKSIYRTDEKPCIYICCITILFLLSKVKYYLENVINVIYKVRFYFLYFMFHSKRKQFPCFECDYKSYKLHTEAYHTGQNVFKCIHYENERNLICEVFQIKKKPLSCSEWDYRFIFYKHSRNVQMILHTGRNPLFWFRSDYGTLRTLHSAPRI